MEGALGRPVCRGRDAPGAGRFGPHGFPVPLQGTTLFFFVTQGGASGVSGKWVKL